MPINMSRPRSEMDEKVSEPLERAQEMTFTADAVRAEMQTHVRTVADMAPDQSRKGALRFAARFLGLPASRIKTLFYGEARRIDAHEADKIRAYVKAAEQLIKARNDYEAVRCKFLSSAPENLHRLVPSALGGEALAEEAASVIADHGNQT